MSAEMLTVKLRWKRHYSQYFWNNTVSGGFLAGIWSQIKMTEATEHSFYRCFVSFIWDFSQWIWCTCVFVSQQKGFVKASLAAICFVVVQAVTEHFVPTAVITQVHKKNKHWIKRRPPRPKILPQVHSLGSFAPHFARVSPPLLLADSSPQACHSPPTSPPARLWSCLCSLGTGNQKRQGSASCPCCTQGCVLSASPCSVAPEDPGQKLRPWCSLY